MDQKKPPQVIFVPGCFDNFDGSQEELDGLIAEIHRLVESGEMLERSTPLEDADFDSLPESLKQEILRELDGAVDEETPRRLH